MAKVAKFDVFIAKGGIFTADGKPLIDFHELTAAQKNNFYRDGESSELVLKAYAQGAVSSTKNASSSEVVLGKYVKGSATSYDEVARTRGSTYFSMDDWSLVENQLGTENMWHINEAFLNQQVAQGKSFILVNDSALATGYYSREVDFLVSQGYSFKMEKGVYRAVKK